jgi:hypothetical protein
MSLNPTFDDVLGTVFKTLDLIYQLHGPETPENEEDPGNCVSCTTPFPCETADILMAGITAVGEIMSEVRESGSEEPTEAPEASPEDEETPAE